MMMIIMDWTRKNEHMFAFGRNIPITCYVRNAGNNMRKSSEIVKTIPDGIPYQPSQFPLGRWNVGKPRPRTDPYKAPYFIPTDAWQLVDEWEVRDGVYAGPTGRQVVDREYGLHFSSSRTTLGCVRVSRRDDILWLVGEINAAKAAGHQVIFEVHE